MNRMSKNEKKLNIGRVFGFIFIVCILFVLCVLLGTKIGEKTNTNTNTNSVNVANDDEDLFYYLYDENDKNEIYTNEIENNVNTILNFVGNSINNTTNTTKKNTNATKIIPGVTNKKQDAIDLVKKEWGEDDTVNFVFDYVNENGEYIVAVKDKSTSTVKNYFKVNLKTQTVEIDY